jgi:xylulokinase
MDYLLGIDIGTYSSKGVVTSLAGDIVASHEIAHDLSIPRPGWAEHDAECDWWGDFRRLSQTLLAKSSIDPGRLLAAGCSTIGPCVLPVAEDGTALRKAILYGIDTRAGCEIDLLTRSIGEEEIFARCGNDLSAQAAGPKILWIRNHEPEVYDRTAMFVSGTSYLVWKLTRQWVIDHYSAASFVPLYERRRGEWSASLSREIVDPRRLPRIAWTTEIAGRVTREAADATGLPCGLPVIVGTIDAAAEAMSVGVVEPDRMMLMYGSTLFMIAPVDRPLADRRLWSAPYLFPGTHALLGGMATAGSLTRWFRDGFARELSDGSDEDGGESAYRRLEGEAEQVGPGAGGIVVLPYFSGERTPVNDLLARGMVFGLTLAHGRAHVYRAILESVGFAVRHHLEVFRELGTRVGSIRAVGGGAKNETWLRIVSDICRRPQEVPRIAIGASYGDAFLAGVGVGAFADVRDISAWLREVREIHPDPVVGALYDRRYRTYRRLYRNTRGMMHELAREEWTPPP